MKKVLIICGTFPPNSMVGGLRPAMFAKYLKQFNWEPSVLTRVYPKTDINFDNKMAIDTGLESDQINRVEYGTNEEIKYIEERGIIKKIRDFFYPEFSSPPGVYFKMKEAAIQLLNKQKFDLIFTTSPDHWEITLGSYLSKQYKIPLVVDFRDIKEQEKGITRTFREHIQVARLTTRRFLATRQASLITTVSKYHADVLHKKLLKNVDVIYNGYDSELFKSIKSRKTSSVFKIIYVGRILDIWYRNPEILFFAIDQLIEEGKIIENEINIDFYGTEKELLADIVKKTKHKSFFTFYDRIPYKRVPVMLSDAQLLLVLTNKDRKGILTTKFFEYAGLQKPVLCIPGDNSELDELISEYKLGYSIDNIEKLKQKLLEWIGAHKTSTYSENLENNVDFFSRLNQTQELAKSFDNLFNKQSTSQNTLLN